MWVKGHTGHKTSRNITKNHCAQKSFLCHRPFQLLDTGCTNGKKSSQGYSLRQVRRVSDTGEYVITIEKNGKAIKEVTVISSPRSSGYFNDPAPPVPRQYAKKKA